MFNPFAKLRAKRPAPAHPPASAEQEIAADTPRRDLLGFAPQNELEWALVRAAEDVGARPHFARVLLASQLFFATPDAPGEGEEGSYVAGEDETLAILRVSRDDGTSFPALFTSVQRIIEAFGYGTGYVAMDGEAALESVAADGAVLNPFSGYGVSWSADDVAAMLGRPVPWTADSDTQILLGVPQDHPHALVARIAAIVRPEPRIASAWLALAVWPKTETRSWYLDVRTTAPRDTIAPLFQGIGDGNATGGLPLDITFRDPDVPAGTGIRIKPPEGA